MPAVRFSRDKRGYEYVYLVHTPTKRGKAGRTRVLYWYRTPPGLRLGRKPFDDEVRGALEAQNPGVTFDWDAIVSTPMPPPDMTEYWRERRRAEKAAKAERRAAEAEGDPDAEMAEADSPDEVVDVAPLAPDEATAAGMEPATAQGDGGRRAGSVEEDQGSGARKRRRRRGGRRRPPSQSGAAPGEPSDSGDEAERAPDSGDEPAGRVDPASQEH